MAQVPTITSMYNQDVQQFGPECDYSINAISPTYIEAFVLPKEYVDRRPSLQLQFKTSIATSTVQLNITSNASGNVGFYVLPINVCGNGTGGSTAFAIELNDPMFDPVTGTNPLLDPGIAFSGPLYPSLAAIQ